MIASALGDRRLRWRRCCSWFYALVRGRVPRGLRNLGAFALRYHAQTLRLSATCSPTAIRTAVPPAGWQLTLDPGAAAGSRRPDPAPEVDRCPAAVLAAAVGRRGARCCGRPTCRTTCSCRDLDPHAFFSASRPRARARLRALHADQRACCRRSCWSSCSSSMRGTASASRASRRPGGSAPACCSAMLGFAFVWLAQLPFGIVAAVVGPPPRRLRIRDTSSGS